MVTVRLFHRRRDLRQARKLARLLMTLDDVQRDRRAAPGRRQMRTSLNAR
jgi:hypothetical protein